MAEESEIVITAGGGYQNPGDNRTEAIEKAAYEMGKKVSVIRPDFKEYGNYERIMKDLNPEAFTHLSKDEYKDLVKNHPQRKLEMDMAATAGKKVFVLEDFDNEFSYNSGKRTRNVSPQDRNSDVHRVLSAHEEYGSPSEINVVAGFALSSREHRPGSYLDSARVLNEYGKYGAQNFINIDNHDPNIYQYLKKIRMHDLISVYPMLLDFVTNNKINRDRMIVVAPDKGAEHRARLAAEALGLNMVVLIKERGDQIDKHGTLTISKNGGEIPESVKQSIKGKHVLFFDDMFSSCGTLETTVDKILNCGARNITAFGTHAILNNGGDKKLSDLTNHRWSPKHLLGIKKKGKIRDAYVTDSTLPHPHIVGKQGINIISAGELLAAGILAADSRTTMEGYNNKKIWQINEAVKEKS